VATRSEYSVERVTATRFLVRKGTTVYNVGLEKTKGNVLIGSCNCPDWLFHSRKLMVPCKHLWLVAEAEGLVKFPSDLPPPPAGKPKERNKKGKGVPVKDGKVQKVDGPDDWTVE